MIPQLFQFKVSPIVLEILSFWDEILPEFQQLTQDDLLRFILNPQFSGGRSGKTIAMNFYNKYKDDPSVNSLLFLHDTTFDYYSSIRICVSEHLLFAFPFSCYFPNVNLLPCILDRVNASPQPIDLSDFVRIVVTERIKEVYELTNTDLKVLRNVANAKMHYFNFINSSDLAAQIGVSIGNTCDSVRKLWIANVLYFAYLVNYAKLGFVTFAIDTTNSPSLLAQIPKDCQLAYLEFPQKPLAVCQYPSELLGDMDSVSPLIFNYFEYGYSLAGIKPKRELTHTVHRNMMQRPLRSIYSSSIVDLRENRTTFNTSEMKVIKYLSPDQACMWFNPQHVADALDISVANVKTKFSRFLTEKIIYPFTHIDYLGYPTIVVIYAISHQINTLRRLHSYLRQFFHYRFYWNEMCLFAYIRLSDSQWAILEEDLIQNQKKFDQLYYKIVTLESSSYVKRSININSLTCDIDAFFGICWK